jgi:hypothetical protein
MRYKICSDFPLHDIIQFHKQKENVLGCWEEAEDNDGRESNAAEGIG